MKNHLRVFFISILAFLLSGCAGVFIAGAATAVYVVTDPRTNSELLNDQDITFQVNALGNKPPFKGNVRVTASTFKGNTLLMGQAVTQSYSDSLVKAVRKIDGVNAVFNQVKVKPLLSISEISNDTWITTKVKSALIADSELRNIKITVYTEDSEVFLVGSVSPAHANKAVEVTRNVSGVKKVIKAFYYGAKAQATTQKAVNPAPIVELSQPVPQTNEAETEVIPYIEPVEVDAL